MPKFGMEIGFDYNDVFSQVLICYISVAQGQNGPGIQACPDVPGLVQQLSTYTNNSSYGFFDATFKPVHRFTVRLGANLTGTSGSQLRLDPQELIPNQVNGPLNSIVAASLRTDWSTSSRSSGQAKRSGIITATTKIATFGTAGAEAVQDIYAPRNFRGNLYTLSVKYAF